MLTHLNQTFRYGQKYYLDIHSAIDCYYSVMHLSIFQGGTIALTKALAID
jgi:hypothetical protein